MRSRIHGTAHVGRVLIHSFGLIAITGKVDLAPSLWAAVYLHDLARETEGRCARHGPEAARLLEFDDELRDLFREGGVREEDFPAIRHAVSLHSHGEPHPSASHARLTNLLKDADGLDRVRLGDLDPAYFRCRPTRGLVPFATGLYAASRALDPETPEFFSLLIEAALRIW